MYVIDKRRGEKVVQKKAQITLFVIMTIVLVAIIIFYFYASDVEIFGVSTGGLNFEACVNDAMLQGITELGAIGATKNPGTFYLYQDEKIPYFCYTNLPYQTCVVQRPLVKHFFEVELKEHIRENVQLCYDNAVDELKNRGFNVTSGTIDLNVTIIPSRVGIDINAPTTISGQRFTDYRMFVDSPIYDMLMVATSIVQYEASYGDAPTGELMYYYPDLVIDKLKQSDSTTLYIIGDKGSDTKLQFASRSLIWPAGFDVVEQ